jgi:hypothetical protein
MTPATQVNEGGAQKQIPEAGALVLDFEQHSICFVVPKGAIMSGDFNIPGGALIYGTLRGRIFCHEGSLVLAPGSDFAGKAEAPQIYVNGTVRAPSKGETSELIGSILVAVSRDAIGRAKLTSRAFAIHSQTFGGQLVSIE